MNKTMCTCFWCAASTIFIFFICDAAGKIADKRLDDAVQLCNSLLMQARNAVTFCNEHVEDRFKLNKKFMPND